MTPWELVGLILLVATTAITVGILLYDLWLCLSGRLTISETQWLLLQRWRTRGGRFPWLVVVLPSGMAIGPVGLLIHFLT